MARIRKKALKSKIPPATWSKSTLVTEITADILLGWEMKRFFDKMVIKSFEVGAKQFPFCHSSLKRPLSSPFPDTILKIFLE